MFDLNHGSRLDQIDAALAAVGLRSDVGVAAKRRVHTCGCDERWCLGRAISTLRRRLSRWRRPGSDAARETTRERCCHDVIVSTLPAAPDLIFMDRRLVGCRDRGRGAEGGCYQQPGERVAVVHRQFGCTTNGGALQAQTVQAPGSDLLLDPVSRRVRQDDLAGVRLEDNLQGGDVAYQQCRVRGVSIASVAIAQGRSGSVHNQMSRDAAGAFRNRVAGVRGRRHRLELVGSVRRSGLRRRPRPVHGQRHGRRGVRVPTRRGDAVDRLAGAKAGKPAPNAVAERVEVLEASSSAFARSGRPPGNVRLQAARAERPPPHALIRA